MQTRYWILLGCALAVLGPDAAWAGAKQDKAIANQIGGEIRDSGQLTNYRVGVKFKDGVAWLTGSVTDESQAAAAMEIAQQVNGVTRVINRLEVKNGSPNKTAATAMHLEPAAGSNNGENAELVRPASKLSKASPSDLPAPALQSPMHEPQLQPTMPSAGPQRLAHRGGLPQPVAWRGQGQPVGQPGVSQAGYGVGYGGGPAPAGYSPGGGGATGVGYDAPNLPGYAWPSYAASQNYSALTYPKQYSPTAWPYIGPFYPYPQVPLGWRKVALEWDDGWWFLDFSHTERH